MLFQNLESIFSRHGGWLNDRFALWKSAWIDRLTVWIILLHSTSAVYQLSLQYLLCFLTKASECYFGEIYNRPREAFDRRGSDLFALPIPLLVLCRNRPTVPLQGRYHQATMRSAGRRGRADFSRSTAESGAGVADGEQPQERRSSVSYSLGSEASSSIPSSIPGSKAQMNAMMNASCPPTVLAAMTAPLRGASDVGSQKATRAASLLVHFPGDQDDESSGDEGINRGKQRKKKKNFLMDRLREEQVHDGKQLTPRRRQQQQQQQPIEEDGHAQHKTAHHQTTSRRESITSEVTTEADATMGDGTATAADTHGHSTKSKDAEHGSSLESIDAPLEALLEGL